MRILKLFLLLSAVLLFGSQVFGSTPEIINYQGRLLDAEGQPIPDGNYEISFTIFDQPTGGISKWSETQLTVTVTEGLFNAVMGSVVPLADSVFSGQDRFLEISVAGQIILPRTQFTSAGYAHRIATVDGATAGEITGKLEISPTDYSVPGNAIAVQNDAGETVLELSVDEVGNSMISFYEPLDAKGSDAALTKSLDIAVSATGTGTISFYEPLDSKDGFASLSTALELSVNSFGVGSISFYEPLDSKAGLDHSRKVEMTRAGLIMFGDTEADTSLIVAPNGDIIGLGQITMGQNSSSGVQTSVLGFDNDAAGDSSSIGGGSFNVTTGTSSTIGGGFSNNAGGDGSTIGGGSGNDVSGNYSSIGGGMGNVATGDYSTIPGGHDNSADGAHSYSAGHRAKAFHNGSFVWADQTEADFVSTADDQFLIRASGGVGIGTETPTGLLDVVGSTGDGSVNFPDDAIASPEIFDEPGISANRDASVVTLIQGSASAQDVITTTITIPASGYIMLTGGGIFESQGTSKSNQAFVQIDEAVNGGLVTPFYTVAGSGDHDSPNTIHFFSVATQRIYVKDAGTYQFRLEAMANPANGSGAISNIINPYITATFFPTAYGTVTIGSSFSR